MQVLRIRRTCCSLRLFRIRSKYTGGMPDNPQLDAAQMAAYFALIEVGSLLQHAIDQQLRDSGGLSYTQFQILAALADAPAGRLRMTDIADRLVHSRSGLTYQIA